VLSRRGRGIGRINDGRITVHYNPVTLRNEDERIRINRRRRAFAVGRLTVRTTHLGYSGHGWTREDDATVTSLSRRPGYGGRRETGAPRRGRNAHARHVRAGPSIGAVFRYADTGDGPAVEGYGRTDELYRRGDGTPARQRKRTVAASSVPAARR
jgi:hypothetical protein